MSAAELSEHARYLADNVKMDAYRLAIRHSVANGGRTFLDLGSGSGILGLLAVREGVERVYAVDSGPIIGPAAEVAAANGAGDAIVHIRAGSTDVELPERVDVAICDQIGGFVHDAGVLELFADARRRHLVPEGQLIPAGFRLYLAPATCPKVRAQIDLWDSRPEGLDFSVFREMAVNTEHRIDAGDCVPLSSGAEVADVPADHDQPIQGSGSIVIESVGSCDGLVGWFEADLGGDVVLTNHPTDEGRMQRWCNFYPLAAPIEVGPGDRVVVEVDVRPLLHTVTWRITVTDPGGVERLSERHSTLLGEFLAPEDLGRSKDAASSLNPLGLVVSRALTLTDGSRSIDQILVELREEFGVDAIRGPGETTVRTLLRRFSDLR